MDNTEILVAAMSDPEFKHRLGELRAEQTKIAEQREELQAAINKNAALVQEARTTLARADAKLAEARGREANAKAEMDKAAAAHDVVRQEEARFEAGRKLVNQQHDTKHVELAAWEAKLTDRQKSIDDHLNVIAEREAAVADLEAKHAAAHKHAAAFVAALDAPAS